MEARQTPQEIAISLAHEVYCNNLKGKLLDAMNNPPTLPDKPLWEIFNKLLNPEEPLPDIQTWCKIGERSALPKEGIIAFSAKQKRGKSLSTYAIAQALLSGEPFDTLTPTDRPNYILVFDLEMSKTTLLNRVKPLLKRLGEYGKRFLVCPLASASVPERITTIKEMTDLINPDIIIIDHCAMLVNNINDSTEAQQICDWLNKLSVNRSVWVVMHENKGAEDTNMRGHVGTNLSHRAVEAYSVDRKDGIFTITYREGRDTSPDDAAPIRFAIDNDGNIIDANAIHREAQERERDKWRKQMITIFGNDEELKRCDIISRVKQRYKQDGVNVFEYALKFGVIAKVGHDKFAPYKLA